MCIAYMYIYTDIYAKVLVIEESCLLFFSNCFLSLRWWTWLCLFSVTNVSDLSNDLQCESVCWFEYDWSICPKCVLE